MGGSAECPGLGRSVEGQVARLGVACTAVVPAVTNARVSSMLDSAIDWWAHGGDSLIASGAVGRGRVGKCGLDSLGSLCSLSQLCQKAQSSCIFVLGFSKALFFLVTCGATCSSTLLLSLLPITNPSHHISALASTTLLSGVNFLCTHRPSHKPSHQTLSSTY